MLHADHAKVEWNSGKKRWEVRILVGAEVIKRPCNDSNHDTSQAELKEMAISTARDEGYEIAADQVEIVETAEV